MTSWPSGNYTLEGTLYKFEGRINFDHVFSSPPDVWLRNSSSGTEFNISPYPAVYHVIQYYDEFGSKDIEVTSVDEYGFTFEVKYWEIDFVNYNTSDPVGTVYLPQMNNIHMDYTAVGNVSGVAWKENVTLAADHTVDAGETLFINPDVNISSQNGSNIISSGNIVIGSGATLNDVGIVIENGGELIANGQWPEGITLDGRGVVFKSGSDGQITNCTIKNTSRAVEINGTATPLIEGCSLRDNSAGVWVNSGVGSGARIIDNSISSNSGHGIASYYSSPTIEDNVVFGNDNGFFGIGSSASFSYNQFESNTNAFYTLNGSSISSATFNYTIGSQLHINAEGASSVVQFSQNDFIPTGSGTNYIARAKYGAMILAYNNYFQHNVDPGLFYATDGASISYTSASQPFRPGLHNKVMQKQAELTADTSSARSHKDARVCHTSDELQQTLALSAAPTEKITHLSKAVGCQRSQGEGAFDKFLREEVRPGLSRNSLLYGTTLELENLFLMDRGNYDQAIANYQLIRQHNAAHPSLHQSALFGLGYIHSLVKEDTRTGGHYLAELQQRYPESSLAGQAGELAEAYSFKIALVDDHEGFAEPEERPEKLSLSNYPNPFNPVTEISYHLPERTQVSLVVYDMLGRQVAELVNKRQSAGTHRVSFDASRLSSGLYLYRLQAGQEVITGKMTLVK